MFDAPQSPASGASNNSAKGGRSARRPKDVKNELRRAQMELVAARERGGTSALRSVLARYPQHAAVLLDFDAGLVATAAYADVTLTPEVEAIGAAAKRSAFATVFGAATVVPAAVALAANSLQQLRAAQKLSLKAVADRMGLGSDVLHALETGRIRAQSVPQRFLSALGGVLDTSAEQLMVVLGSQATVSPRFRRGNTGETKESAFAEVPQLDFADMIRLSTSMTDEQKAAWLDEKSH